MHAVSATLSSEANSTLRRVLVVDDDEGNATLLARLLQSSGHDVRMANDGPTAIAEASQYKPHVVFLDIGLPGMSGYEVAQQLRATASDAALLVVAVSGYEEDAHDEAPRGIFDHWLVKPVPFAALQDLVKRSK